MPKLYRDAAAARHETPDVAELRRLRDTEREELHSPTRRLDAYYYSFNETGSVPIDAILSAVAIAGKSCHNTDMWTEDDEWSRWGVGRSLVDVIQCAANEAAAALLDAAAERDRLARLLDEPRRSGCAVEIAGVRIAPCDERGQTADMRERDTLADRLAHMTEARDNARAEVKRLTAQVELVREWIDHRGVDVSDRDGAYMDGYRAAQRHALQDAAKLRRALDEEPQP